MKTIHITKTYYYSAYVAFLFTAITHCPVVQASDTQHPQVNTALCQQILFLSSAAHNSRSPNFYTAATTTNQSAKNNALLLAVHYQKMRFFCCCPPSTQAIQRLLVAGANPQFLLHSPESEESPVRLALTDDLIKILELFIRHDASLLEASYTPIGTVLYGAIHAHQPQVVRLLLQHNASLEQTAQLRTGEKIEGINNDRTYTPLAFAQALQAVSTKQSERKKYQQILQLLEAHARGDDLSGTRRNWLCLFS